MIRFVIPGEPQPKERARGGQGRFYTPASTVAAEKTVKEYGAMVARRYRRNGTWAYPTRELFWVGCVFYLGCTVSKNGFKARNADLDNLLKLTLDGLKGCFWFDDNQVRGFLPGTRKVLGSKNPQTIVLIQPENEEIAELLHAWIAFTRTDSEADAGIELRKDRGPIECNVQNVTVQRASSKHGLAESV